MSVGKVSKQQLHCRALAESLLDRLVLSGSTITDLHCLLLILYTFHPIGAAG